MRDNNDEPAGRFAPRGDRNRSFGSQRDRDWKSGRRDARPDHRDEAPATRDSRGGGQPSGGRAPSGGRPPIEDMDVFRLAHELALRAHQLTSRFPAEERSSLVALLRRASAAVPAQLAAGFSRWDRIEFRNAVNGARDAAAETRYFLLLTKDVGHLSPEDCDDMREGYERVAKMLSRLAQALEQHRSAR